MKKFKFILLTMTLLGSSFSVFASTTPNSCVTENICFEQTECIVGLDCEDETLNVLASKLVSASDSTISSNGCISNEQVINLIKKAIANNPCLPELPELPTLPELPVLPDFPELPWLPIEVSPENPIEVTPENPIELPDWFPTPENPIEVTPENPIELPGAENPIETPDDSDDQDNSNDQNVSTQAAYENRVLELVNIERAKYGIEPLQMAENVRTVAREKSRDMSVNNYFSHTSPTYGSPFDMLKQFGVSYSTAGENIAMGQTTPEQVVNAWMNSEGHRANILNPNFTHIGVGYYAQGNYWTQMFIG